MLDINIKKKFNNREYHYQIKTKAKTLAIMGESGSGKTTLLRLLSGLLKPDGGHICYDNRFTYKFGEVNLKTKDRKVGYVFQSENLFPHLTVEQNLKLGLKKESYGAIAKWLSRLGLVDKKNSKPDELSGGEKQRIAIIRSLLHNPDFLLLDEAFNSLDADNKRLLYKEIKEILKAYPGYTILVTHDTKEALKLAEEIYVLKEGNLKRVYNNLIEGQITAIERSVFGNTLSVGNGKLSFKVMTLKDDFQIGNQVKVEIKAQDIKLQGIGSLEGYNKMSVRVKEELEDSFYLVEALGNEFYVQGSKLTIGQELKVCFSYKTVNIV